ncbi:MAG: outer membrane beta-barrel protein [Acidobacteriota bacterium]|nr:outer membrane beta-barrel protein [Acidobacteriota bacterium]MDH3784752.1 outer membrane beta-barrel protein [Acidobacteriota bacterium]
MHTKKVWIGLCVVLVIALTGVPNAMAEDDNWLLRTRLLFIAPNDDADGVLESVSTEVDADVTIEVDASYFFTPNWSVEAILATAAQEVTADLGGGRVSLGSVYHAPATVLGQYHFNTDGKYSPYVGAGLNYTIFYSESGTLADLDLDSGSFGLAAQAGIDCTIGEGKVFNFDVKYINIEADVSDPDTVLVGGSLGMVEVNPLVVGVGFGFRF